MESDKNGTYTIYNILICSKVQYSTDLVKIFHTFGCNFLINLIPDKILMNIMVGITVKGPKYQYFYLLLPTLG